MKVVIIGGTTGGAGVAARLRRLGEKVQIAMIERNPYVSYAGCGLPYYAGGIVKNKDDLFVVDKAVFDKRFRVRVSTATRAVSIDRKEKCVYVKNLLLQADKVYYDKLVIATGATPIVPPFAKDKKGVFTLRTVEDAVGLREYIEKSGVTDALVVGGGFIGLEACENLWRQGLKVTLAEKAPQVMAVMDEDMAKYLHMELESKGVTLKLGVGVSDIAETADGKLNVTLDNGSTLSTGLVVLAIGVRPESTLAADCGLEVSERGFIVVDDTMRTSDPDIFALGDVVTVKGVPEDRLGTLALAGPAAKQARVVSSNLLLNEGEESKAKHFKGSLGVSIVRCFNLTAGSVGKTERFFAREGVKDVTSITVHTPHHVSWFETALPVHLKLVFNKVTGEVLGAQAVGQVSVDKNLEVISALMQKGATVYDLADFESAYAPPFSAPRSPVNMAGCVAANVVDGLIETVNCADLEKFDKDKTVFLDIREKDEFEAGSIPGFINLPMEKIREEITCERLDPDKTYVLTCQVGVRGYTAACILRGHGIKAYNLNGGYVSYQVYSRKLKCERDA